MKKLQTIDDVTGTPGGFKKFIKRKERFIREVQENRQDRIRGLKPRHDHSQISINEQLAMLA